jgi:short-subunit dehydrogenase
VSDQARCAAIVDAVVRDLGGIDVLVNNAGANKRGPVERREPGELAQIVSVNLIAPIVLTRLALPHLRRRGRAAIVNVASIAGQVPLPEEATYSATKFGLRAFTFAVREELLGSGITVSAVSPGPVETGFILEELDEVPDLVFANPMSSADEIAAAVLDCAADGSVERTISDDDGHPGARRQRLPRAAAHARADDGAAGQDREGALSRQARGRHRLGRALSA